MCNRHVCLAVVDCCDTPSEDHCSINYNNLTSFVSLQPEAFANTPPPPFLDYSTSGCGEEKWNTSHCRHVRFRQPCQSGQVGDRHADTLFVDNLKDPLLSPTEVRQPSTQECPQDHVGHFFFQRQPSQLPGFYWIFRATKKSFVLSWILSWS